MPAPPPSPPPGESGHDRAETARGAQRDGGGSLPRRAEAEKILGRDLSRIQAFTGVHAARANRALGAEAFTVGSQIAFSRPDPDLDTVVHEATHAIQQGGDRGGVMVPDRLPLVPQGHHHEHDARAHRARPGVSAPALAMKKDLKAKATAKLRAKTSSAQVYGKSKPGKAPPVVGSIAADSVLHIDEIIVGQGEKKDDAYQNYTNQTTVTEAERERVTAYLITVTEGTGSGTKGSIQEYLLVELTSQELEQRAEAKRKKEEEAKAKAKKPPISITLKPDDPGIKLDFGDEPESQVPVWTAPIIWSKDPLDFKPLPALDQIDFNKIDFNRLGKPPPMKIFGIEEIDKALEERLHEHQAFEALRFQGISIDFVVPFMGSASNKLLLVGKYKDWAEKEGHKEEVEVAQDLEPGLKAEREAEQLEKLLEELEAAAKAEEERLKKQAMEDTIQHLPLPRGIPGRSVTGTLHYGLDHGAFESLDDIAKQFLSSFIDLIPIIGDLKGLVEAVVGHDLITGDELPAWARGVNAIAGVIGLIPIVGQALRIGAKAGVAVARVAIKLGTTSTKVVRTMRLIHNLNNVEPLIRSSAKTLRAGGTVVELGADQVTAIRRVGRAVEELPVPKTPMGKGGKAGRAADDTEELGGHAAEAGDVAKQADEAAGAAKQADEAGAAAKGADPSAPKPLDPGGRGFFAMSDDLLDNATSAGKITSDEAAQIRKLQSEVPAGPGDLEDLVALRKKAMGEITPLPGTPERMLLRWQKYAKQATQTEDFATWAKRYGPRMAASARGRGVENTYRAATGGVNTVVSASPVSKRRREIDTLLTGGSGGDHIVQIKSGPESLSTKPKASGGSSAGATSHSNKDALAIDREFIEAEGKRVTWVYEKGASGPLIKETLDQKITAILRVDDLKGQEKLMKVLERAGMSSDDIAKAISESRLIFVQGDRAAVIKRLMELHNTGK